MWAEGGQAYSSRKEESSDRDVKGRDKMREKCGGSTDSTPRGIAAFPRIIISLLIQPTSHPCPIETQKKHEMNEHLEANIFATFLMR